MAEQKSVSHRNVTHSSSQNIPFHCHEDNNACIDRKKRGRGLGRAKHIAIRAFPAKDQVKNKVVELITADDSGLSDEGIPVPHAGHRSPTWGRHVPCSVIGALV